MGRDGRGERLDSRVHVRFYRASKAQAGTDDVLEILQQQVKKPKAGDREYDLGEDVVARLERCETRGDFLEGEFCRIQKINFPPQAGPDGLEPIALGKGNGIGHVAAFQYHVPTRVILLQRNMQSVSSNRLSLYLAATKPGRFFSFAPVLSEDAMQRFKNKKARGFTVTFAGIDNLSGFDDESLPAARGAKLIAEAYDGVRVTIDVNVGRSRKKWLDKSEVLDAVSKLSGLAGVKKLKVKAEQDGDPDLINFMKEQRQAESVLTLPEGVPDKNYEARKLFLRKVFSDNLTAIQSQFK